MLTIFFGVIICFAIYFKFSSLKNNNLISHINYNKKEETYPYSRKNKFSF